MTPINNVQNISENDPKFQEIMQKLEIEKKRINDQVIPDIFSQMQNAHQETVKSFPVLPGSSTTHSVNIEYTPNSTVMKFATQNLYKKD